MICLCLEVGLKLVGAVSERDLFFWISFFCFHVSAAKLEAFRMTIVLATSPIVREEEDNRRACK